ncbi:MAG: FAD binding domain-containing protein [Casimicrobiaceae bacterium]
MKPASFDYLRVDNVSEAQALLAEHGADARILAGGQSLLAVLNMRLAAPRALIDISQVRELDYVRVDGNAVAIGAAVTQTSLQAFPGLERIVPLAARVLPSVAHLQIRNKGTVCGSIAHADPSAELPLVVIALGGEVVLGSTRGRRHVPADAFFLGMLQTACAADEMIVEVRLPVAAPGDRHAFHEVSLRQGDFALVALAAIASGDRLSLAVGGVADRPVVRHWNGMDDGAIDDALNHFAWSLAAQDDIHASARYRRHLVRVLGRRLLTEVRA